MECLRSMVPKSNQTEQNTISWRRKLFLKGIDYCFDNFSLTKITGKATESEVLHLYEQTRNVRQPPYKGYIQNYYYWTSLELVWKYKNVPFYIVYWGR